MQTIGRILTGIEKPTSGSVDINGVDIGSLGSRGLKRHRRKVQLIFQDPFQALTPASSVQYAISRPLANYRHLHGSVLRAEVDRLEGTTTVSQCPGTMKDELDVRGTVKDALPLMRRIKQKFDPGQILNPGRFVGGI